MKTAIVNLGVILTGDWREPVAPGDSIVMDEGRIVHVGTAAASQIAACDVVIDADGAIAIPGLIDSHVHITFGDYTPRQRTVGFLESYVHGGTTTSISASEVHVPGRPKDPEGVKALAVAAMKCFENYRPGGMRVCAGSVILEPGLKEQDFEELARKGVWLAKAGFGAFDTPFDYAPHGPVGQATRHDHHRPHRRLLDSRLLGHLGRSSHCHAAGRVVPRQRRPHRHAGPRFSAAGARHQHCAPGLHRRQLATCLWTAQLLKDAGQFERLLVATDTPTGSGVMPLGMLYTISHLASLAKIPVEWAIAAATGNNAEVYRLNSGYLRPGRDADVVVIDACAGGSQDNALDALRNGDIAAVAAVVSDGIPRFVGRSRNTPGSIKNVRVADCKLPRDFSGSSL